MNGDISPDRKLAIAIGRRDGTEISPRGADREYLFYILAPVYLPRSVYDMLLQSSTDSSSLLALKCIQITHEPFLCTRWTLSAWIGPCITRRLCTEVRPGVIALTEEAQKEYITRLIRSLE